MKMIANLASIRHRRAVLADAYRHLEYISGEQWKIETAGLRWWDTAGFHLEETAAYMAANSAVNEAKKALPFLLRLGIRTQAMSTKQRHTQI